MGAKGGGATTVLRAHGVLSGILADAVKSKRLSANPARGVENLPRKTGKRHVYLSADDVYRLADESGQYRALVLVLAYTGIRWGEAVGLACARCRVSPAADLGIGERGTTRCEPCRRSDQGPQGPLGAGARSSCSTSCRRSAAARSPATWCSRAGMAAIFPGRSRRPDGSPPRSRKPRCRRSRPTICGIPVRRWLCQQG